MFTRERIAADLRKIGVESGDILLVHSSFRSIGKVENGAEAVVGAFFDVLGADGTLLMPGFARGKEYDHVRNNIRFDARTSASQCGYLTEYFRQQPGAFRSLSPTHSLTGIGKRAAELLAGHELCDLSIGYGSPFDKMMKAGGKILLLGITFSSCTFLHFCENVGGAPTVCRDLFPLTVVDAQGTEHPVKIHPQMPSMNRAYDRIVEPLEAAGKLHRGNIGDAPSFLCRADDLFAAAKEMLEKNPAALIDIFVPQPYKEEDGL